MTFKVLLSAAAVAGVLAIGSTAFAQDKDMDKPMHKPMHHHAMHRHAMHHEAMHHEHMAHHAAAHHGMHGGMGVEAKERAETAKLNQGQLQHPGM
jgi:pentapeptide MXKDX repeat protein